MGRISPTLPNELIEIIIVKLNPDVPADQATLANVLRVSSEFWELAAPLLYRSVFFDGDELFKLLDCEPKCKQPISERKRRSLSFIRRLNTGGGIEAQTLERFVDVSLPDTPLFPNVEQLHLGGCSGHNPWVYEDNPPYPPPKDFVLFNAPDVCVWNWGAREQLAWLPMRGMRSFAYHGHETSSFLWDIRWVEDDDSVPRMCDNNWVPLDWTSFQIYDETGIIYWGWDKFAVQEQRLRARRPGLPPVEYFSYYDKETVACEGLAKCMEEHAKIEATTTPGSMMKLSAYTEESKLLPPPCVVCGESEPAARPGYS